MQIARTITMIYDDLEDDVSIWSKYDTTLVPPTENLGPLVGTWTRRSVNLTDTLRRQALAFARDIVELRSL